MKNKNIYIFMYLKMYLYCIFFFFYTLSFETELSYYNSFLQPDKNMYLNICINFKFTDL